MSIARSSRSPLADAHSSKRRSRCLRLEPLEARQLLSADVGIGGVDLQDPQSDRPMAEPLTAEFARCEPETSAVWTAQARTVRDAGQTRGTAFNLGELDRAKAYRGSVGWWDQRDVIRFSLSGGADVQVTLSGTTADLQLRLYDAEGRPVARSNRPGTTTERIHRLLEKGTYYAVVDRWLWSNSGYHLFLDAEPVASTPPVTAPDPAREPVDRTVPSLPSPATAIQTPGPSTGGASPVSSEPPEPLPDVPYYGSARDWNVNQVRAPESWAQGYLGQGVTVAVVDTGVDLDHPELNQRLWVNPGEIAGNGRDDDGNGFIDDVHGWDFVDNDNRPDDGHGHGTHVAGTIAAARNGIGTTGIAPQATILPVRALGADGSGSATAVAAGIRYAADNGVDIINLSLGGAYSSVIDAAIRYAGRAGSLIVAAAGNGGAANPGYPARFSRDLSFVLSVGAHDSDEERAGFSNRVSQSGAVQVDAPGVGVTSTISGSRYGTMSGTSMAAPHVAGLAALALSAQPSSSAAQLRSIIVAGAGRSISGSDAGGGIDAATTVAYAIAGYRPNSRTLTSTVNANTTAPHISTRSTVASLSTGRPFLSPMAVQPSNATRVARHSVAARPRRTGGESHLSTGSDLVRLRQAQTQLTDHVMKEYGDGDLSTVDDGLQGLLQPLSAQEFFRNSDWAV